MSTLCSTALAPAFDWTSAGVGLDGSIKIGSTTYPLTLPSRTNARMVLGVAPAVPPSASVAGVDFVQYVAGWLTSAIAATGLSVQWAVANSGVVTLQLSSGGAFTLTLSATLDALLGAINGTGTSRTGTYAPKHLAVFVSREGRGWASREAIAVREDASGAQHGVRSGVVHEEDEFRFEFLPLDPVMAAALSEVATPWHPAATALTTIGAHACPWSVRDVLKQALARPVGFASGNWDVVRADVSQAYDLVTIVGEEQKKPRVEYQVPGYEGLIAWTAKLLRRSTPTATRS